MFGQTERNYFNLFNSLLCCTKLLENGNNGNNVRVANSGDIKKETVSTLFMAMLNNISQLSKQSGNFHAFILSGWKSRLVWRLYVKLHNWKIVMDIPI